MRIIKHGDQKYYRENEVSCETCGCKFKYKLDDISVRIEFSSEENKFSSCKYISCPECKTVIFLEELAAASSEDPETTTEDPESSGDPIDPNPTGG